MRKLTWSALRHWRSRQGQRRSASHRALLNLECLEDRTLMSVSVAGGFSGLLGIGGGPIKVPVMYLFMKVPLRVAAATRGFS